MQCAVVLAATTTLGAAQGAEPAFDPAALARELQTEVAELRGLAFERDVPVEVIDDEAAGRHLLGRVHAFQSADELDRAELAFRALGLLPPRYDVVGAFLDVMREQAAGYYDPTTGAFYLLYDVPDTSARVVMVHELTHALEDQHFDLDARLREVLDDDDRLVARSAIHEGSATLLMLAYLTRKLLAGEIGAEALAGFQEMSTTHALGALPETLQRQLVVPYLLGAAFLARGNALAGGRGEFPAADVDRAYRDPPASSEQILHPDKYWSAERSDAPREVELGDSGAALGAGFERTATGVLGELGLGPLVGAPTPSDLGDVRSQDGARWTNDAAAGWGGDRWELWQRGNSTVVLLLTVWDTEADAGEFLAGLRAHTRFSARRERDRVAVVAGAKHKRAQQALARLLAAGLEPGPAGR